MLCKVLVLLKTWKTRRKLKHVKITTYCHNKEEVTFHLCWEESQWYGVRWGRVSEEKKKSN